MVDTRLSKQEDVCMDTHVMIRTNIHLKPSQKKKLRLLSMVSGASVAEIVRRAIDEYLGDTTKEKRNERTRAVRSSPGR